MTDVDRCPTCKRPFDANPRGGAFDKADVVPSVEKTTEFIETLRTKQSDPPPADLRKHLR